MTVKECYEIAGADFNDVMGRLGSEAFVKRFALAFLKDSSFEKLKKAMEEKNAENAFPAAHTLKGVSANLGFSKLTEVSSELTEKLRGRNLEGSEPVFAAVENCYIQVIEAIQQLAEG